MFLLIFNIQVPLNTERTERWEKATKRVHQNKSIQKAL